MELNTLNTFETLGHHHNFLVDKQRLHLRAVMLPNCNTDAAWLQWIGLMNNANKEWFKHEHSHSGIVSVTNFCHWVFFFLSPLSIFFPLLSLFQLLKWPKSAAFCHSLGNLVNSEVKCEKQKYFDEEFANVNNAKEMWKKIDMLIGNASIPASRDLSADEFSNYWKLEVSLLMKNYK